MCPAHIVQLLDQVKQLRARNQPVALVSTQIIEAGVDISFPVVYRAECGLDSFAQAAGRCNRNGELEATGELGKVYLFAPSNHPIPPRTQRHRLCCRHHPQPSSHPSSSKMPKLFGKSSRRSKPHPSPR